MSHRQGSTRNSRPAAHTATRMTRARRVRVPIVHGQARRRNTARHQPCSGARCGRASTATRDGCRGGRGALRQWAAQACMPTVLSSRFAARSPSATCTSARSAVGPGGQRHCLTHPWLGEREGGSAAHRPDVRVSVRHGLRSGLEVSERRWGKPALHQYAFIFHLRNSSCAEGSGVHSAAALWAARVEVRHSASSGVCSARHARKLCTVQRTKYVHPARTTDADAIAMPHI
jgi:hypothetical protein